MLVHISVMAARLMLVKCIYHRAEVNLVNVSFMGVRCMLVNVYFIGGEVYLPWE